MNLPPDFAYYIASQALAGVALYAAIRADLREALVRCAQLEQRMERMERRS